MSKRCSALKVYEGEGTSSVPLPCTEAVSSRRSRIRLQSSSFSIETLLNGVGMTSVAPIKEDEDEGPSSVPLPCTNSVASRILQSSLVRLQVSPFSVEYLLNINRAGKTSVSGSSVKNGEMMDVIPPPLVAIDASLMGAVPSLAVPCMWNICRELFYNQKDLVEHVLLHIKADRKYKCLWEDCHRRLESFDSQYKLVAHARAHTGEKPYVCHHHNCHHKYTRLENLKTHLRSHNGEKPFKCAQCTSTFSNISDKLKHQNRTHSDMKPYECNLCTNAYTDPSSLRKHVKNAHSEEEWEAMKKKRAESKKRSSKGHHRPPTVMVNSLRKQACGEMNIKGAGYEGGKENVIPQKHCCHK